ncbi:MAG: hypothetical protein JW768_14510 [Chitinispirillaceae bacterium]|nr:hypothetical protein [Chitinispirillaceae bacterium]
MNTKKVLLLVLIIAALCVWGRNVLLIFKGVPDDNKTFTENQIDKNLFAVQPFVYKGDFRDPFFCKQFMHDGKGKKTGEQSEAEVSLPQCSVGGIVYNEKNPMILFRIGAKSLYAKQGDVIDSITIKKINRDSVEVVYKNKKFVIGK